MRKTKFIIFAFVALAIVAVASIGAYKHFAGEDEVQYEFVDTMCSCPHTVICLQPMDDFSQKEAERLKKNLQKHVKELELGEVVGIEVLPSKKLTPSLMNDAKTRYRADKIIRYVQEGKDNRRIIIALTHKDISVPLRGKKDWGVLGLSLRPGTACAVSTFRVKDKSQLWKVAIHEFCHTYYNMPHCPNDDPTCIMKDARGHEVLSRKTHLCKDCKERAIL